MIFFITEEKLLFHEDYTGDIFHTSNSMLFADKNIYSAVLTELSQKLMPVTARKTAAARACDSTGSPICNAILHRVTSIEIRGLRLEYVCIGMYSWWPLEIWETTKDNFTC